MSKKSAFGGLGCLSGQTAAGIMVSKQNRKTAAAVSVQPLTAILLARGLEAP